MGKECNSCSVKLIQKTHGIELEKSNICQEGMDLYCELETVKYFSVKTKDLIENVRACCRPHNHWEDIDTV